MRPALSVLIGRLSEGLGHTEDALAAYRAAADSWDRPAAAQGRLRETLLRYAIDDLKRDDVVSELETLTAVWRGDETEVERCRCWRGSIPSRVKGYPTGHRPDQSFTKTPSDTGIFSAYLSPMVSLWNMV
jgi:hypothetical protein